MALSSSTMWEVRPTAGSDSSGGGFVEGASGTDFSQQNAAQGNGTNLTVDATTNTDVTPDAYSVTSADVGNIIQITAGTGFTQGFYEIKSIQGGTKWRLDRSPAATSTAGGTWAIGGALATIGRAITAAAQYHRLWVTGNNVVTSATTISISCGQGPRPFTIQGYGATRGDSGKATWTTSTNSTKLVNFSAAAGILFKNFTFSNTAGVRDKGFHALGGNSVNVVFSDCVLDGFTVGIYGNFAADWTIQSLTLENTEIKNCSGNGVENANVKLINAYIHDNGGDGVQLLRTDQDSGPVVVIGSTLDSNTGAGLNYNNGSNGGSQVILINSDFYGNANGVKFSDDGNPHVGILALNNVFYNNSAYGINLNSLNIMDIFRLDNAFGANGTAAYNGLSAAASDITLTADPFTNAPSGNFTSNATAGGGALLKQAGRQCTLTG
jgi:hypothetical protein